MAMAQTLSTYQVSCFPPERLLKFELWTEWRSWQTSTVNHQEGNKGSKDNVFMQSLYQ